MEVIREIFIRNSGSSVNVSARNRSQTTRLYSRIFNRCTCKLYALEDDLFTIFIRYIICY